jgi:hypothetical protein
MAGRRQRLYISSHTVAFYMRGIRKSISVRAKLTCTRSNLSNPQL